MKDSIHDHAISIPISSTRYAVEELPTAHTCFCKSISRFPQSSSRGLSTFKQDKVEFSVIGWMNKFSEKANNVAQGIREHVSLGSKISETMKGKLSLGTRIIQAGGVQRVFERVFSVEKGEKLLKASQCYLSTTAGPIAGMLFMSTQKIAFLSDRYLTLPSSEGGLTKFPYKVVIPLRRVKMANSSENLSKRRQKYIQITTIDEFEFWFMGLINYQKSIKCLQQAMSELQMRS